ncbi:hypothetical protein [Thermococcus sp.]|uniref:hypothetical protein n=1 Tax=Thermococcus sp. TaxID=35749 RepID=UPI0026397D44|nr:hypothetical protein [Thermococcus sp.]MCD6143125.1 hypothetical protein [Thermococcus sp.]
MEEEKEIKRFLEDAEKDLEEAKKYKKLVERFVNIGERMGADMTKERTDLLSVKRTLEDIESAIKEEKRKLAKK